MSRKAANRNRYKVYTKSDARKVLSDVLREQLVFGKEEVYGALYGKHYTEVVDKLWHVLNDAAPGGANAGGESNAAGGTAVASESNSTFGVVALILAIVSVLGNAVLVVFIFLGKKKKA